MGYLFQAAGLLLFAITVRHRPKLVQQKSFFVCAILADGLAMLAAVLSPTQTTVLAFGLLMNLLHGVVAGIYLTILSLYVPQQRTGAAFGIAYGLGSIGSWLLSLVMDGRFLQSPYSLIVYFILIGATLFLNQRGIGQRFSDNVDNAPTFHRPDFALIALVVILLSVVKGLGFYFPLSESTSGSVSLEFSRAFYAIGLIAAGFINDRNRKYGAICCLAALVFPFISIALMDAPGADAVLWILAYVFFGFFAVWRVIVFCDIAAKKSDLVWMAGFGLLFGRVGDAAGAFGGILLSGQTVLLVVISAALFVVCVLLFFALYHKLYVPVLTQEQNEEQLLAEFEHQYELSARESDVFRLVEKGRSNSEIAGDLYISESTVKFHVKNILRKTDCGNRTELSAKFRQL